MGEFVGPGMMSGEGQGPPNAGGFMSQGSDLMTQARSSPDYMPPGMATSFVNSLARYV